MHAPPTGDAHVRFPAVLALTMLACGAGSDPDAPKTPYEALFRAYGEEVVPAWTRWREAEWKAHTEVTAGDTTRAQQAVTGHEGWRAKATDPRWVREARDLQRSGSGAPAPTTAEKAALDAIARTARLFPANEADLVARVDQKAGLQARFRKKATPKLDGEDILPEELARRYAASADSAERKALWRAILGPSGDLKPTYAELRELRNELARKGGWQSHTDAVYEPYGMTSVEVLEFMTEVEMELRPLYQELHTWARHELGNRYMVPPPELIPAHWLPTPLGDDWGPLAPAEAGSIEPALQAMGAKKMVQGAEEWFVASGVPELPPSVWERSSLFPVPPGARTGKSQGAATWDIDLNGDVRILMSAKPTTAWLSAAYRELAYAHATLLRDEARLYVPLRMQAPDATIGALGLWADLAATRPARLVKAGLAESAPPETALLLAEALAYVPFVQFGAGTVVPFEYEVYAEGLPPGQMNSRWWGLVARHQGVFPPETRTERWGDFLAVDALQAAPGRYAENVLSVLLAFQLHEAACQRAGIDPRTGDLAAQPVYGPVFERIATGSGMTDWRELVQETTGAPPSAGALLRYFQPLQSWLATQNAGRTPALPPLR